MRAQPKLNKLLNVLKTYGNSVSDKKDHYLTEANVFEKNDLLQKLCVYLIKFLNNNLKKLTHTICFHQPACFNIKK